MLRAAILVLAGLVLLAVGRPLPLRASAETPPSPVEAAEPAPAASADLPGDPGDIAALPRRLRIPAIGVDAEIEFVGLTPEGTMDVPQDPDRVAWLEPGPRPGQPGNAALAGHVDWGGKTRVFWRLKELGPGDTVQVLTEGDQEHEFEVLWSRWFDADTAAVEEVFGGSDAPEVTLITCGGAFDARTRQYLSRLVVRAALR